MDKDYELIWAYDKSDDDKTVRLTYACKIEFGLVKVETDRKPTLVELADFLDQEAENDNHHSVVGVHEKLGELMKKEAGEEKAIAILTGIAEAGGLWEMARR